MSGELAPGAPSAGAADDGGDSPAVEPSRAFGADAPDAPQVLLSVTKGNLTPEELAALTAVLAAVGSSEPEEAPAALTRRERLRRAALRPRHAMSQRRGRF
ncbi:acyl-CoA carboxylase epsilon subunit [Sinomonas sp. ASV322]|uniref:acyl-CoA carboxylase epsilon subunit n=1 Tax=Sinomonas sp. ASV322 TaxID=3041920 RepID=UPI0027DBF88A|nr:acyl-CoA carboxylase epsilon subunit [Sinomonas sp. ASV322]MDQ4502841.1 acyl-CoA carboxylase epsilon subunit [Sinomonas sp. ASV322]